MPRYALINDETKVVTNVIELEDGAAWAPPKGSSVIRSASASPGDTYSNRKFVRPPATERQPTRLEQARTDLATATQQSERNAVYERLLGIGDTTANGDT